jgi:hypothetical protein
MYNNNAQYNTMTIHNVVQYESNVCILYTMPKKSFPAGWIRPAPSAAAAAAAAIQLMQACRPSQKPSRDLTRAMDWSACASRALCMPLLTAVRTTATDRSAVSRYWLLSHVVSSTTHPIPRYIESAHSESTDCCTRGGAVRPASMSPSARLRWFFAPIRQFRVSSCRRRWFAGNLVAVAPDVGMLSPASVANIDIEEWRLAGNGKELVSVVEHGWQI